MIQNTIPNIAKPHKLRPRHILCVIFALYICANCALFFRFYAKNYGMLIREACNVYFESISPKQRYVELYGGIQKVLGKRQIEEFTIFKNDFGRLVSVREKLNQEKIYTKLEEVLPIFEYLDKQNIGYLYMTNLLPVEDKNDLPIGVEDYSAENAETLLKILKEKEIAVLNLRNTLSIKAIPKEDKFYRTDHHWTNEAVFASYQEILNCLQEKNLLNGEFPHYSKECFSVEKQEKTFLGSYGIKVGKYYTGKDDFKYYKPDFSTELFFSSFDANGNLILTKQGEWEEALMELSLLNDPNYNNKHASYLNACSIENRIINNCAGNDLKILLVSHSYGRPLAQYLSLNFAEVRHVDPQEGRFQGNYIDYIDEYAPDFVLFLVEFEGEIIGNYKTSGE